MVGTVDTNFASSLISGGGSAPKLGQPNRPVAQTVFQGAQAPVTPTLGGIPGGGGYQPINRSTLSTAAQASLVALGTSLATQRYGGARAESGSLVRPTSLQAENRESLGVDGISGNEGSNGGSTT